MTALPTQPQRLLTVADFLALPEDAGVRHELQEGVLVMPPRPSGAHQLCVHELLFQLRDQLPRAVVGIPEVDVDLGLAPPGQPGFVRAPDLVVVPREALHRGRLFRASEVLLAVEVVSPGSRRLDTIVKRDEYADAGIPHYWVVDLIEPVTLTAHHLAGEFGYADGGTVSGAYAATAPFPVRIDLEALG